MSRQAAFVLILSVIGVAGLGVWSLSVDRQPAAAGLWFDDIQPEAIVEFTEHAGTPLTPAELASIESGALQELRAAYAGLCLPIAGSPASRYRLHVRQELVGLIAAGSRSMPGLGGAGEISFRAIAAGAVGFAPRDADRHMLVEAIGRGIGRTAAHELAHQVLGSVDIHDPRDRSSYEYPDLRREHFYSDLHWTIAAAPLAARLGRCR